jgi:4-aminobutyrate aminotransferase
MAVAEGRLSFSDAPRIRVPPPGPRSKELLNLQGRLETDAVAYPRYFPMGIREARGATIEDVDGNRYIDWLSGISVLNLGHRHPRVEAAVRAQMDRIWHTLEIPTEARVEFLQTLSARLPGSLKERARTLFTVTGGDCIETAVSLAGFATKRRGIIAFSGAYHGVHGGAVDLTSGRKYRATSAFHGATVYRVPFPDPYRPLLDRDGGVDATFRFLEALVREPQSGLDEASAVLVEPILGEGGYVVPPDEFLPRLREFCDENDLLLILDEVQTGLGRTGRMWACEHASVTPDILCVAKSIGGGLPVSLVAYRADLVRELPAGFHLGTYRGNPLALAAGTEVLKILTESDLLPRTQQRGRRLVERFREIQARHPSIGDVRGRGFMIGVEFVEDRASKRPDQGRAKAMRSEMFRRGLLMHTCGGYDQVLRFMAPLVIEDDLLEKGLAIFEDALATLDGTLVPTRPARALSGAPVAPGRVPTAPVPEPPLSPPGHHPPVPVPPGRSLP